MSSLSPQLQKPYQRFALRVELWLLRQEFLRETRRNSEDLPVADDYGFSWRPLAKPFFISLRALGVVLMSAWFISFMYDLGPQSLRPWFLLLGALLCWLAVEILEE